MDDMSAYGVEALDCISVDNALVRPGDPLFAGLCWQQEADCGAISDDFCTANTEILGQKTPLTLPFLNPLNISIE